MDCLAEAVKETVLQFSGPQFFPPIAYVKDRYDELRAKYENIHNPPPLALKESEADMVFINWEKMLKEASEKKKMETSSQCAPTERKNTFAQNAAHSARSRKK